MKRLRNIIDGIPVEATDSQRRDVVNPATEQVVAQIPVGSAADAAAAVNSARLAHPGWARLDLPDRLDHLSRIADNVERHVRELAELENEEMGKPIPLAEQFIAGGIAALRHSIERPSQARTRLPVRCSLVTAAMVSPLIPHGELGIGAGLGIDHPAADDEGVEAGPLCQPWVRRPALTG
ncbi:aldehyde dehydrogenase family protein [Streptomyces sp. NPDC095613]|uniref:aldehyde dehydrogenase family protein n=1 Tax=Streptomyces sp. NPDC095613 TaxID=3155540 RepID=UPI003324B5FD